MTSVVDICNIALSRIGNGQRIDSLDERSAQAEQCGLFYELTRDAVLRDFNWPFATKYQTLAQVATSPDATGMYNYAMPDDCLFARRLVNDIWPAAYWPYRDHCYGLPQIPAVPFHVILGESGRLISTSITPANLEYTAKVEDSSLFDSQFVSALSWKLAVEISLTLAKEQSVAQACEQQYQIILAAARAQALNESAPNRLPESSFITGRN